MTYQTVFCVVYLDGHWRWQKCLLYFPFVLHISVSFYISILIFFLPILSFSHFQSTIFQSPNHRNELERGFAKCDRLAYKRSTPIWLCNHSMSLRHECYPSTMHIGKREGVVWIFIRTGSYAFQILHVTHTNRIEYVSDLIFVTFSNIFVLFIYKFRHKLHTNLIILTGCRVTFLSYTYLIHSVYSYIRTS